MTAFAAILQKGDDRPDTAGVAEAIGSIGGVRPAVHLSGRCALIVAPLHRDDPGTPLLPSGLAVAGSMLFEGQRDLATSLGEPASTTAAVLVDAAYTRWGDRCTDRLAGGEYAFALWDSNEQTLLCARDGIGLRLLYVAHGSDTIVVTNSLSAALRHPAVAHDLDEAAAIAFLAHGGPADQTRTCYRHVSVLPPGHTLILRPGATAMRRHWRFPLPDGTRRAREADVLHEYRSVLAAAVRDRVSEGGTSIFLSGGVDSTTIAAAATEVTPPGRLHAVTTRYPRYGEDGELPYAREAAGYLALPLTVVDASRYEPWHAHHTDAPSTEPLDEPMLADWRAAVGVAAAYGTAALYGEDGDVLLRPPGWRALRNAESLASIGLAAARYAITERRRPYVGLRWRERLGIVARAPGEPPRWLTAHARALLDQGAGRVLGQAPEPLAPHPTRPETQDLLTSTTVSRTFAATIAPELTRQRVELRFPLYDTRVIGLVVSLPPIPWCQHKALPRRAYRGRLPARVLNRPKTTLRGFNDALVAAWRDAMGGRPTSPGGAAAWIEVEEWKRSIQTGEPNAVMAAWRVIALDAWLAARSRVDRGSVCTR